MPPDDPGNLRVELDQIRSGIRQIAHDISTPLGVLRMVAYYLRSNETDGEKRDHYLKVIGDNVDKVEASLDRLRGLSEPAPAGPGPDPPHSTTDS